LPVGELEGRARTTTNLAGMQRWGYITIEKDPADRRPKPPRSAWVVRAAPVGRKAREVWQSLIHAIEKRRQQRFGEDEIAELRESLWAVARQFDLELPDCLSILGYGLFSKRPDYERRASARSEDSPLPLPAFSPGYCWRSPSSLKPSQTCRLRSVPTSRGFWMRKACGFATFRS
jgi:hypothetical protein